MNRTGIQLLSGRPPAPARNRPQHECRPCSRR
jgi:hypothetical protein